MDIKKYEYYRTDLGVLYCADCLEILPHLEPVDLVLTDPPYNVGFKYESFDDTPKDWVEFFKPIFLELRRLSKITLISTGQKNLPNYAFIEPWKWLLAWCKPFGVGFSPVGFSNFEPIAMWGNGPKNTTDLIIASIHYEKELCAHPFPKPFYWAFNILENFKDYIKILDPFLGSGTTAVACERLKRRWIGIEIEEKYCEISKKRIEAERRQLKLF